MNVLSRLRVTRKDDPARAGISIASDGVSAAEMQPGAGGLPRLRRLSYQPRKPDDELTTVFSRLRNPRCKVNSVVSVSAYQLLLVEAPDVPEAELRAAVRWRIKDLIDFHIDDAVIDVFEMPEQSRGGQTRMMYAIAARTDVVQQHVDLITSRGMQLHAIDIPELCLRNIAARVPEDPDGVALRHLADDHGRLTVTRQGIVYLTRRIETGVDTLSQAEGLRAGLVEGLALEVRRSLDYIESHYDQKPVQKLYVTGIEDKEIDDLGTDLSLAVQRLSLRDFVTGNHSYGADLERRCLPAVGAALRADALSL